MSDRSVSAALSCFVIVAGLAFYPGNTAQAAEPEHGNPGQFMDNIREGLSGLSRYFWSPKTEIPVTSKKRDLSPDKKVVVPASKAPKDNNKTANTRREIKPAIINSAKDAVKPGVPEAKKAASVPISTKKSFESKAVVDRKKQMVNPPKGTAIAAKPASRVKPVLKVNPAQKAAPLALKAHVQPQSQSRAIASVKKEVKKEAKMKTGKSAVSGKLSALTTAKPPLQKDIAPKKSIKSATAVAPVAKSTNSKKPALLVKKEVVQKPAEKKQANAVDATAKKNLVRKASKLAAMTVTSKPAAQKLVRNDKGTYIWFPKLGSQLSQRFGTKGIVAKNLAANGDLNRTDGRWIFVPRKRGPAINISRLSNRIHTAQNGGVWVGGGRSWVYVFDSKRTYGSIVGGKKANKVTGSKSAKAVASVKPDANLKSDDSKSQKSAPVQKTDKPRPIQKSEKAKKSQIKKSAKALNGVKVQKTVKQAAKNIPNAVLKMPKNKRQPVVERKVAGTKTARSGKWSKSNNRWVYVPNRQPGQAGVPNIQGFAAQVAKAPVTGGWVQRNNRWIYVAPQKAARGKASAPSTAKGAGPVKSGVTIVQKKSVVEKPKSKGAKLTGSKAMGSSTQKPRVNQAFKTPAKTGLAEGPDAAAVPVTKNQKTWVRKNNGWVYATVKPAPSTAPVVKSPASPLTKHAPIGKEVPVVKSTRMARQNNIQKRGAKMQTGQKPAGEFMFFVPGRTPGSGSWFAAPLQLLEKARKLNSPAYGGGR